ncbi:Uncharacterized protein TCM_011451 [Theobroma cacao]|uniref:Uncharacterized protein n=1 Tax=Theobroma cacao TaxID=3641 RepID=A0A061EAF1_THECC|nr:Uncharacterized protein TCM_011451 [Theobroma cacao]
MKIKDIDLMLPTSQPTNHFRQALAGGKGRRIEEPSFHVDHGDDDVRPHLSRCKRTLNKMSCGDGDIEPLCSTHSCVFGSTAVGTSHLFLSLSLSVVVKGWGCLHKTASGLMPLLPYFMADCGDRPFGTTPCSFPPYDSKTLDIVPKERGLLVVSFNTWPRFPSCNARHAFPQTWLIRTALCNEVTWSESKPMKMGRP